VRPATVLVVVVTLIGLIFGSFDVVAVMTRGGGPLGTTETLSYFIYGVAFKDLQMGYASAISVILFALIFVGTLLAFRWRGEEATAA
jgi:multiple sugar transport system permease protein